MSGPMDENECQFLEENIATVAFHLGQPGAKLSVRSDKNALMVDPGEVLKEISRRLTAVPAQRCAECECKNGGSECCWIKGTQSSGDCGALSDALEQIWAVCLDNKSDSCNHKLALDFVRQIAGRAVSLSSTQQTSHDAKAVISDGPQGPNTEMQGRLPRDAVVLPSPNGGDAT